MKIIITEEQYGKLTKEKLRKLCYAVWNNQKKRGKEPHIDDVIYDVSGIQKDSNEDYKIIRPIWYEYNGGFNSLADRIVDEIEGKIFDLKSDWGNLDTKIKVDQIYLNSFYGLPKSINISVDLNNQGTMDFMMYEEGTDNEINVNDTIEAAYMEALGNYESTDFKDYLEGEVYDLLYKKIKKYGIPLEDVSVDLKEF
jgi:hypothetical protein